MIFLFLTQTLSDCDADVDSDLDTDAEVEDPVMPYLNSSVQESSIECASDIEGIAALSSSDLIDSGVKEKLTSFNQSFPQFKRSSNSMIPIYTLS